MALTTGQVIAHLKPDEPDYAAAATALGEPSLPLLADIVAGRDRVLAPRAAYLAGLIAGDGGAAVVADAATSPEPRVRSAAAATAAHLELAERTKVLAGLLRDEHIGVVQTALAKLGADAPEELKAAARDVVERSRYSNLRQQAIKALRDSGD
jgi:HEAT repeat protein